MLLAHGLDEQGRGAGLARRVEGRLLRPGVGDDLVVQEREDRGPFRIRGITRGGGDEGLDAATKALIQLAMMRADRVRGLSVGLAGHGSCLRLRRRAPLGFSLAEACAGRP